MARITLPWAKLKRARVVEARGLDGGPCLSPAVYRTPDWTCRSCGRKGEGQPPAACPSCRAATVVVETGSPEKERT